MIKFSIIIGVYNSERFLPELITSIQNQSYQNYEVIFVANNCTDRSVEIITKFKIQYPDKVTLIDTDEKLGAGGARKLGLFKSNGEYIVFVDNDDILDINYLKEFFFALQKWPDMDIVSCDFQRISEDGSIVYTRTYESCQQALVQNVAPWAKAYKREFLINNSILPENIPFGEDILFTSKVILSNPFCFHINKVGYLWRNNLSSTSHTELLGFPKNALKLSSKYIMENLGAFSDHKTVRYFIFKYYIWYLFCSSRNIKKERVAAEVDNIIEFIKGYNISCFDILGNVIHFRGERPVVSLVLIISRMLIKLRLFKGFVLFYSNSVINKLWPSL